MATDHRLRLPRIGTSTSRPASCFTVSWLAHLNSRYKPQHFAFSFPPMKESPSAADHSGAPPQGAAPLPMAEPFGRTADGQLVEMYTLSSQSGVRMRVITFGAIVVSLEAPDRAGRTADVVLGLGTLAEYERGNPYFGAVVGRFGNRIANGRFALDGREYQLATNNHPAGIPCALHGGLKGFDKAVWKAEPLAGEHGQGLRLTHLSTDGDEGYPGNLLVHVTYWLSPDGQWRIDYHATSDRATPVNLTQHTFFNLRGEGTGDILGHEVTIHADRFTPVGADLIPTGELRPLSGSPLDFRTPHLVGERVETEDEQLRFGRGYDHNFVLNAQDGRLALAARVREPESGRVLEVLTTEPGLQFYCGNFLDGTTTGKKGAPHGFRTGLCLETQHYPDSPNQPSFPCSVLRPGQELRSTTVYRFLVE